MFTSITWNIEDVDRYALIYVPEDLLLPVPAIIAFHGHGGTDTGFSLKGFEILYPRAIVVYPQGLPTKSSSDPHSIHSGWQHVDGEVNIDGVTNQDIKFFDQILNTLQTNYKINKIFLHGWSNGGEFLYNVLWKIYGTRLAAIATASAILNTTNNKPQIPVMHIAGEFDPFVPFDRQKQNSEEVRALNECYKNGRILQDTSEMTETRYSSVVRKPVVFLQYPGQHGYPDSVVPEIVRFFKSIK